MIENFNDSEFSLKSDNTVRLVLFHANVLLPTGMLVAESALFGPILADRVGANGLRAPRARVPENERVLLGYPQQRRCRITEALPCLD